MEADMACPHHPATAYVFKDGKLQCPECGYVSPYQRVHIDHLVSEHKRFADKLFDIQEILNGEGTPTHKIAEIQLIVDSG